MRTWEKVSLAIAVAATAGGLAVGVWAHCMQKAAEEPIPAPLLAVDDHALGEDEVFPQIDWGAWGSTNPDVIGWVTVTGTGINHPVAQAPASDPGFYLDHDSTGGWNPYGCPYLDAECADLGFDSPLALVYGHHVDDGSMFTPFARFSDREFAEAHSEILLQTPTEKKVLEVIAVDVVDADAEPERASFASAGEFDEWAAALLAGADLVLKPDAEPESLVAFCTCSYGRANERTIVYAEETDGA